MSAWTFESPSDARSRWLEVEGDAYERGYLVFSAVDERTGRTISVRIDREQARILAGHLMEELFPPRPPHTAEDGGEEAAGG